MPKGWDVGPLKLYRWILVSTYAIKMSFFWFCLCPTMNFGVGIWPADEVLGSVYALQVNFWGLSRWSFEACLRTAGEYLGCVYALHVNFSRLAVPNGWIFGSAQALQMKIGSTYAIKMMFLASVHTLYVNIFGSVYACMWSFRVCLYRTGEHLGTVYVCRWSFRVCLCHTAEHLGVYLCTGGEVLGLSMPHGWSFGICLNPTGDVSGSVYVAQVNSGSSKAPLMNFFGSVCTLQVRSGACLCSTGEFWVCICPACEALRSVCALKLDFGSSYARRVKFWVCQWTAGEVFGSVYACRWTFGVYLCTGGEVLGSV